VRDGGGVFVWHAGKNAFADWPPYNEMIGLGWRKKDFGGALAVGLDGRTVRIPAGEGHDTGHGARLDTWCTASAIIRSMPACRGRG
jgi:hypothetical protein